MAKSEKRKKISTNLPEDLLRAACACTGNNQTDAIIAGLKELIAASNRKRALSVRGKIHIDLDLDKVRERVRL